MKTAKKILSGTVLFCIVLINPMSAGNVYAGKRTIDKITRTIGLKGEKHLIVKIDIGAGIIDLRRNRTGDILNAEVEYDPDELRVEIEYDADKDEGTLYLESDSKRKGIDLDKEDHYWNLEFTDRIPITFEIDVGACEADLDFTGLKIDRLDMDLGASSVDVDFREPNPVRIHKISIDVGASALTIIGLGNANFDRFSFDGGIGDFTLDFSGDFKHRGYVDIDVGLGSLTIRLPKDAGVEIKSESSFLSSFSIDEDDFDEVDDDLYQNDNFGETDKELIFDVDIGLGSIDIECIDR
ncbi:MAG: toast rack family protein [Candidatus Zixiibacteriota bacterium]